MPHLRATYEDRSPFASRVARVSRPEPDAERHFFHGLIASASVTSATGTPVRANINAWRERAEQVRAYLCSDRSGQYLKSLRWFPSGCCKAASLLLLQWLSDTEGVLDAFGVANARRPNARRPGTNATHFWLEIHDVIIDITADQFDDFCEPVHVSTDREWHDTFTGGTRFPQSELLQLSEKYTQEYQAMADYLRGADNIPGEE